MEYSGAGGKLIHEKNQKQKSRDTVPLTLISTATASVFSLSKFRWKKYVVHSNK